MKRKRLRLWRPGPQPSGKRAIRIFDHTKLDLVAHISLVPSVRQSTEMEARERTTSPRRGADHSARPELRPLGAHEITRVAEALKARQTAMASKAPWPISYDGLAALRGSSPFKWMRRQNRKSRRLILTMIRPTRVHGQIPGAGMSYVQSQAYAVCRASGWSETKLLTAANILNPAETQPVSSSPCFR